MLIRIDVAYPHLQHLGEQFPASPSTLFQAIIAANGHRLAETSDVLEALEQGTCLRIVQRTKAESLRYTTCVPKYKASNNPDRSNIDVRRGTAGEVFIFDARTGSPEPTMKPNTVFMLEPAPVHVSYYFEIAQGFSQDRLRDVLRLNILGRGESVVMSQVSIVNALPVVENGTVLEPAAHGRQLNVPYAGFLRNLRLLYDNQQTSLEAPKQSVKFAERDSVAPYATIVYDLVDADGETFTYPQSQMSDIAAMMRHAMITATRGRVDAEYVSGHTKVHPFYIPIPSMGHKHVDGNIRRVVVAEPITAAVLQNHLVAITSLSLVTPAGQLVCRAMRRTVNDGVLDHYLQPARVFHTVTPMVLDRNGGEIRIGKRISALFQKAGYPAPTRVSFNHARWTGKLPLGSVRSIVHAEVEFPVPVSGVVVAGLGAGYGIGLFYANPEGFRATNGFA